MLDNDSFNMMVDYWQEVIGNMTGRWCPKCGNGENKRFGFTKAQAQRFRCKYCGVTFTKKAHSQQAADRCAELLQWLESHSEKKPETVLGLSATQIDRCFDALQQEAISHLVLQSPEERVATITYRMPFKGGGCWIMISCGLGSGRVLWLTPMCIPLCLPKTGRYSALTMADRDIPNDISGIDLAVFKENQFILRSQFDRLNIGECHSASKRYTFALPVLTAHTHFNLLCKLGHGQSLHSLEHEVFLRGACITQFSDAVKNRNTALYYFVGRPKGQEKLKRTQRVGWWKNLWREYCTEDGKKFAVSLLCGKELSSQEQVQDISLAVAQDFVDFIKPYQSVLGKMVLHRAVCLLGFLAVRFNEMRQGGE